MSTGEPPLRHVVIGSTLEAVRTCAALQVEGSEVVHLRAPGDRELALALAGDVSGLAVLLHDDTQALRYCLAAEHLRPGIPMVVALFDKTAAAQLLAVVPNCRVTSPADLSTPSFVAAALPEGFAGVARADPGWLAYPRDGQPPRPYRTPRAVRLRARIGLVLGQFRPHDSGSRILLAGLAGLLGLLVADTLLGIGVLGDSPVGAFHAAVRTVATVGPVVTDESHPGYLLFAAIAMLTTIGLTGMFTAGLVEHLLSGRLVGLYGRRVLPTAGHVVVVGMGQVGLRLAAELRTLGVGVIGVERNADAPNLRIARGLGIPVLVGDGSARRTLVQARAHRALALCAVASDELDNVAAAVTARAVAPELRVALRAGNHDAIAETQSLFRIGTVCDVTGLTAAFVVHSLLGRQPHVVVSDSGTLWVWDKTGRPDCVEALSTECSH